ncbi:MAG: hypothetical protein QG604_425 [Candidatus Dependentiae bacterium]|nr:hypothetical protein [Candidatus Dependentiae bacterium]
MNRAQVLQERLRESVDIATDRQAFFFKTKPGGYAEHDRFLGVKVPTLRLIAKDFFDLSLNELQELLDSPFNEERLIALFILIHGYKKAKGVQKELFYQFYLRNLQRVNNWNLVDASARDIIGVHLLQEENRDILLLLVSSENMWERRVAIVATWAFIRSGDFEWTLKLAQILMNDRHDLIHKATGWMLREVGERDLEKLVAFLDLHASKMPRTALRYAIEKFSPDQRAHYLSV